MGFTKLKDRIYSKFNASNYSSTSPDAVSSNTSTGYSQLDDAPRDHYQHAPAGAPTPQWQSYDASQPTYRPADHHNGTSGPHYHGTAQVIPDAGTALTSAASDTTTSDEKPAIKPLTERELAFEKTLEIPRAEIDKCKDADERRKIMRQYLRMQKRGRMYKPW
ncbi:hypothetical protein BDV96DRAFT_407396 [Lophiotrema nucula]|uniref:Uncharacterized protein n=1 Tax=Lophiotrema nucula TaxID=690887 RepID=A0A6A5ZES2_9PLEO|nr:hypothetical protein BDV96DRAFT_407396 [Lophiotrema nucula]